MAPVRRRSKMDKAARSPIGKVSRRLAAVLPPSDDVRRLLSPGQRQSCAVVGNGGSLLVHKLGAAIDRHDHVIRLNAGPTSGFEAEVGMRTSFRVVNEHHMHYQEASEMVLQVATSERMINAYVEARMHD
eukprot:CAMPEP_0198224188 /NCGR_PEP_ID=MMETSP1445-20131203/95721_1 /TAXON_ID=36898 /ORGANISM="Pyramimonas sp., Strain CCMP2087" /LENGTH=129 /DNA_ID=CAMNT_0043903261 /DNA_START=87 /DNA_END=473 /DNA_ORIENTATION=+